MYSIVGGTTKKINNGYAIVGGQTRKVNKIYAIVGGITKLVWELESKVSYIGRGILYEEGDPYYDKYYSRFQVINENETLGDLITIAQGAASSDNVISPLGHQISESGEYAIGALSTGSSKCTGTLYKWNSETLKYDILNNAYNFYADIQTYDPIIYSYSKYVGRSAKCYLSSDGTKLALLVYYMGTNARRVDILMYDVTETGLKYSQLINMYTGTSISSSYDIYNSGINQFVGTPDFSTICLSGYYNMDEVDNDDNNNNYLYKVVLKKSGGTYTKIIDQTFSSGWWVTGDGGYYSADDIIITPDGKYLITRLDYVFSRDSISTNDVYYLDSTSYTKIGSINYGPETVGYYNKSTGLCDLYPYQAVKSGRIIYSYIFTPTAVTALSSYKHTGVNGGIFDISDDRNYYVAEVEDAGSPLKRISTAADYSITGLANVINEVNTQWQSVYDDSYTFYPKFIGM